MEHVAQQVKELKKNLTEMEKKLKKAPEDFQKQMDKFLEVYVVMYHMFFCKLNKIAIIICIVLIY